MTSIRNPSNRVPLRPTGRAWWLLVIGILLAVAGDFVEVPPLRWMGIAIALLPVLMLVLRALVRPRLSISRTVTPAAITAGERLRVVAEVRNHSVFGVEPGAYIDHISGAERNFVGGVLPAIGSRLHPREGRRRRRIAYGIDRMRRGVHEVGPLLLENVDGLGLTRRVLRIGEAQAVEVWPQLHDVSALEIPALRSGNEVDVSLGRSGEADDVITREYRRGDPLRRVHWKTTARVGDLRVRQEEHHAETAATIVLNTAPAPDGPEDAVFDLAVSVAASVLVRLQQLGFDTVFATTHPSADAEGETLDQMTISAGESPAALMRRLMLIAPAPAADPQSVRGLAELLSGSRGPLIYVGPAGDTTCVELAMHGTPAIAILLVDSREAATLVAPDNFGGPAAGPGFAGPGAVPAVGPAAFDRAGWQTVTMDAAAADPWHTIRTLEVAA